MESKIFFAHIMKTGGSSIKNFLYNNFPNTCYISLSKNETSFVNFCQVRQMVNNKQFKYFCDHKLSSASLMPYSQHKTFTIVRDPITHFISFYNYVNYKDDLSSNDPYEALNHMYVYRNIEPKTTSQLFHISEGYGLKFLMERIQSNTCLVIPFEYISDIPNIFRINQKLPKINSNIPKILKYKDVDLNLRKTILKYREDDQHLYCVIKKKYEENRNYYLQEWINDTTN